MSTENERVYVVLPERGEWELGYLLGAIEDARGQIWSPSVWHSGPALVSKSDGSKQVFTGQSYDPGRFQVVLNGWTHDHCGICWSTLAHGDSGAESNGQWLCPYCFKHFIEAADYELWLNELERVLKPKN